jgi:8-oxo-dGTP pyrophosphatase MutT (NUDIX family)
MESNPLTAVGVLFFSVSTRRYLYVMRNDDRHPNTWGLPGGKSDSGESLLDTIQRECKEELDLDFVNAKFLPLEKWTASDQTFSYHTFFCQVDKEFVPTLNDEHLGYAWIDSGQWPRPMHPGLWNTVNMDAIQQKIKSLEKNLESTNYYVDDTRESMEFFKSLAQH